MRMAAAAGSTTITPYFVSNFEFLFFKFFEHHHHWRRHQPLLNIMQHVHIFYLSGLMPLGRKEVGIILLRFQSILPFGQQHNE